MTDLTSIVTRAEEIHPKTTTVITAKEASSEKSSVSAVERPVDSDRIKLSFTSQAKLLKQQGQDPQEIAANLGVTQQQVTEALERAGDSIALLSSLQGVKS